MVSNYIIRQNTKNTVTTKIPKSNNSNSKYQSEIELEESFIKQLVSQGYEYLKSLDNEENLIKNLRLQLEILNKYKFTDQEWQQFFDHELANDRLTIQDKTEIIQRDYVKNLLRDNGEVKNIYLLKKENIHENSVQVINQFKNYEGEQRQRYDVTILINGFPMVHIELKRRGGYHLKEAFNQINRYALGSFRDGKRLFEYVQVFVISNGTETKYYSNTIRNQHYKKTFEKIKTHKDNTRNSFEFTNWWTDIRNNKFADLTDFTSSFFAKNTILNIITTYCVFNSEKQLLVMRPYQIVATETILQRIESSTQNNQIGDINSGGYIWHTTGSGKTLTSFKTAQLASNLPNINKVIFVVDRKDLDYQTMNEYNKYENGSANGTMTVKELRVLLEKQGAKIIITTIQKLDRFVKQNVNHRIFGQHVVLIFDECHRSQSGEMHQAITKAFKKYNSFGFTGTPIFHDNTEVSDIKATETVFGELLHKYTILNAINDKNVLPFFVDYVGKRKNVENAGWESESEKCFNSDSRVTEIVKYILSNFDKKTKRNKTYQLNERRKKGFNSILAVASIEMAKKYYSEFKNQISEYSEVEKLKIALIYSSQSKTISNSGIIDENPEDTQELDESSLIFLKKAIKDYNQMHSTSFDTSSDRFQNYYKDVSKRVKNQEIDILIVVNMFLTGFDAPTLNTLWVDKKLRLHGLLQAFSRTNRILNNVKSFGNIVCFRNLETEVNKSLELYGGEDGITSAILPNFDEQYYGYTNSSGDKIDGYKDIINKLLRDFPVDVDIKGEKKQTEFIKLFNKALRKKNILDSCAEFKGKEILSERDWQNYRSKYLRFAPEQRRPDENNSDTVFEIELLKSVEVNYDYIKRLVNSYKNRDIIDNEKDDLLKKIYLAINSSPSLSIKKPLIDDFIYTSGDDDLQNFAEKKKVKELDEIIRELELKPEQTYYFVESVFENGYVPTHGQGITKVLKGSIFCRNREKKKSKIVEEIDKFHDIYHDVVKNNFRDLFNSKDFESK